MESAGGKKQRVHYNILRLTGDRISRIASRTRDCLKNQVAKKVSKDEGINKDSFARNHLLEPELPPNDRRSLQSDNKGDLKGGDPTEPGPTH